MIEKIINVCARNRFLVFTAVVLVVAAGLYCMHHVSLDALPDISDVQVVIHTAWPGQPPSLVEDQVSYPLVTAMLGSPRVSSVRAQTMFGDSYVFVIFQDGTDLYWARSRVLEALQRLQGQLPAGVTPVIGPDATGAGWVYEYALVDHSHNQSLADLRALQDWYLRYQLETVPGVAEVATIGGFQRQYQLRLDPGKLRAFNIGLRQVIDRVRASTNEVGGNVLEMNGARYFVRGFGYIRSLSALAGIPVGAFNGTPVYVRDLGVVSFGPASREGAADWNGEGEVVGGIVIARYGANALTVINGVKRKLAEIGPSLPAGVEIRAGYDRSELIQSSIATLRRDLIEEMVIVSIVIVVFLLHFRSALIPILTLPIALLASFIPMYFLHVSANIMSLGGMALAVGVLVDAAIVLVENGHRKISASPVLSEAERRERLLAAAREVGPALFFSLLIIVVAFLPVFLLQAQEGRMFAPLAWTKTLAVTCSSILAITLVPALMMLLIRGRIRPESENSVSRFTQRLYLPVLHWCLRHRFLTIFINVAFLLVTIPLALSLGSQFMPPLFEGAALYMPTSLPGISITQASQLLQSQDRVLHSFPEVASVFGTVGRSDSATDNAPLDMYDTTVMLKPRRYWPAGMTYDKLISEMNDRLQIPGLSATWTMPVENRLDMELTGLKTPVGLKLSGPDLAQLQRLGVRVQNLLQGMPQVRSVFAERNDQGLYINIHVDRQQAARYGLTVGAVQRAISTGIGGSNVAQTVDGRQRFSINIRYNRDFRKDLPALRQVLVDTASGTQIPLGELAQIQISHGPAMIRDENGLPTSYVYIDLKTSDYGTFVRQAARRLAQLRPPPGYAWRWSGEYKFQQRARHRLMYVVPLVFFLIFVLLYIVFRSALEAIVLILPTLYAVSGGLLLQWALHYNFSVAVWVGYIALFGIAIETGVVMVVYLREAVHERAQRGALNTPADVHEAAIAGAVHRLRPKLMTVATVLASLTPVLLERGIGSDLMKPIAAPIVGGMITSAIHVLVLVPVFFVMIEERRLAKRLKSNTPL